METMLVTHGLNELKLLDSRILKRISDTGFITCSKKSAKKISGVGKDTYRKLSKSGYDSVIDLIARRNAIKSAIVKSNAITKVTIAGKEMTVAEAIERKSSISYEHNLLNELTSQLSSARTKLERENAKVDEQIDALLTTAYGKDSKEKISEGMHDAIAVPYREANEYEYVEGFDVKATIVSLSDDIDSFLSEVDTVLQVSNSTTTIEV